MTNGIDVSLYQGQMNWDKARQAGAQFAYIRFGIGNEPDILAARNVAEARRVGIPFGGYWANKPDKSWQIQGEAFAADYARYAPPMPPWFDWERNGGLSKAALESWYLKLVNRFMASSEFNTLEELTCYTSAGYLNGALNQTNWIKRMMLSVAHYTLAAAPLIPNEWANINNPKPWVFWQWSADRPPTANALGAAYGVPLPPNGTLAIDLDRFNGDAAAFQTRFGVAPAIPPIAPPPPTPNPIPTMIETTVKTNLRASPWGTVVVLLPAGLRLGVTGTALDAQGKRWLQVGAENRYVAGWVVDVVE